MSRNSSKSMIRNDKVDTQNSQPSQNMKSSGSTTNLKNVNIVGSLLPLCCALSQAMN